VTSLGLVQMTRKRVGEGLLEAFSETCPTCGGRGVIIHDEPVDDRRADESSADEGASKGTRRRRGQKSAEAAETATSSEQRRAAASAMAAIAAKRDDSAMDQGDVEPTESDLLARTARTQSQALTRRLPTGSRPRSRWSRPTPPDQRGGTAALRRVPGRRGSGVERDLVGVNPRWIEPCAEAAGSPLRDSAGGPPVPVG
jgi:ribonuclease E